MIFFFGHLSTKYLCLKLQNNMLQTKSYYMRTYSWRETLKMKKKIKINKKLQSAEVSGKIPQLSK